MPKIGVFSPASRVSYEQIQMAVQTLEKWGYEVFIHPQTFAQNAQFAGTAQERLKAFQELLQDDSIDIIWCSRGGYGVVQWIEKVDFSPLRKKHKWIVGFSDVTVLHCALQKLGIVSLHAPMLKGWENLSENTFQHLQKVLQSKQIDYQVTNSTFDRLGKAQGKLIGGNIALLHNQIGTSTDFDTENAILFLEDVNEPLYNLDRMLRHLQRAGKFEKLQGLIVGNISRIKPEEPPFDKNIYEIISEIVEPYNFPACFDFPVGHESENFPMVCGAEACLEVTLKGIHLSQQWD
ncbi:MAG: LD-carboxypeptidase [Raineya sp.]|nr:LD-carboxypeptidase [Raineya sp.]